MNNAKMWLVVPPAVGVPVFLAGVAIGSFAVHTAVLTNTSWVADFLKGNPIGSGDQTASIQMPETDVDAAKANFAMPLAGGETEVMVILPDGTKATAILKVPAVHDETAALVKSPRALE
ncbi:MAG: light-harvesting protein [Rhodobacteraceae bacterium]|nr:light-harvesting protein [Paracoccaceae bacterium]